ncbi:hypothetical protein [Thiocapsa sp.]|uniref:hypothetical protein n=1 Tax=Thiocapsa sp. TaxID=2024551 RepID=UPI001BCB7765|nr:hypothetical protein [Thiocapsa sp.]
MNADSPLRFEKVADHAHARAALLADAPVCGNQDPAQPHHALGRLDEAASAAGAAGAAGAAIAGGAFQ